MVVSERILTFSVIIIGLYLSVTDALGRYVIEQKYKSRNNFTKHIGVNNKQNSQTPIQMESTNSEEHRLTTSISGHRVPVTGPRQLQKQQFDSTNVRTETVFVMSILGGALVCLILFQVWRQISAFKKRRLRNTNSQIIEAIKDQSGAPWNPEQIQFVSAELVGDASANLPNCDCEIKASIHRQGYEKVSCVTTSISDDSSIDDAIFDSLVIPENYPHRRPEVVHVNLNVVQVVHHCAEPDAKKCTQDGCGKTSNHKKKTGCDEKDSHSDKNCISSSVIPFRCKKGYENAIIDMDDLKKMSPTSWDNNKTKKGLDNNKLSPSSTSRKSLITNCESSDSERYDTVVNLQNLKHSDTAALLVKDGIRK